MIFCPVQNLFFTVIKYIHSAISSAVAHLLRGVSSITFCHSSASFKIQSFNCVITPPGSILLHTAPYFAIRIATFFVYANTPPLLATYSGNSDPEWAHAEPMFRTDLIFGCIAYFSVTAIRPFRLISISSSFCVPALFTSISTPSISGSFSLLRISQT